MLIWVLSSVSSRCIVLHLGLASFVQGDAHAFWIRHKSMLMLAVLRNQRCSLTSPLCFRLLVIKPIRELVGWLKLWRVPNEWLPIGISMDDFNMSEWCAQQLAEISGSSAEAPSTLVHSGQELKQTLERDDRLSDVGCAQAHGLHAKPTQQAQEDTTEKQELRQPLASHGEEHVDAEGVQPDATCSCTSEPGKLSETDPIYKLWVPRISRVTDKLRSLTGGFTRQLKCATLFGGLSSERKVTELFGIPCRWRFTCDVKESVIGFNEDNYVRADHHYMDASQWLNDNPAEGTQCLYHDREPCSLEEFVDDIDVLFVTESCKPFSMSRTGRMAKGVESHPDYKLFKVTTKLIKKLRPKALLFEQVFGFTKAKSSSDAETPLAEFIQFLSEELGGLYDIVVFFTDGGVFIILTRHRVFVLALLKSCGGKEALERLKLIVQAVLAY